MIHLLSGLLITAATAYFCFTLFIGTGFKISGTHTVLGFGMLCTIGFVSIGGLVLTYVKKNTTWNTRLVLNIRLGHKLFGFLIWFAGIVTLSLGLGSYAEMYQTKTDYLVLLNGGGMVAIFLICELIYRNLRKGEDPWVTKSLTTTMTEHEFESAVKRGEQLWILDDLVLNLTPFMPNHPGGAFVL
jgi:hypothetical protein